MKIIKFTEDVSQLHIGIVIKEAALIKENLVAHYIEPLKKLGLIPELFIAIGAKYADNNKISAKEGKEYVSKILNVCKSLKLDTLLVADTNYFKYFTKLTKTTHKLGSVISCGWDGFKEINILLSTNYQAKLYNDRAGENLNESLKALENYINHAQTEIGNSIIKNAFYPKDPVEAKDFLYNLHKFGALTCDIETYGLRFNKHFLATIAFGMDKHTGVAFNISHGKHTHLQTMCRLLKMFFQQYKGQLVFHNALFDIKFLVAHLFMQTPYDYEGMQEGLSLFRNSHCTQVLTFIATNSTGGNNLTLKDNALEFTGNYAQDDIKDVTKILTPALLEYNLIDTLATWYLIEKYDNVLADPDLMSFYTTIAQPSLIPTIKMMLVGLPMDMQAVHTAELKFQTLNNNARLLLKSTIEVKKTEEIMNHNAMVAKNKTLKKLVKTIDQFDEKFNPGSPKQLGILLYDIMQLPVLDWTKTKQRGTGAKTLTKLLNMATHPGYKTILESLISIAQTDILLNNFIKNFKELAYYKKADEPWLNGNLKTTGTQSGRYSSSEPNMQNMPSTSTYAKDIKRCFAAPAGWVIGGADFSSLEDRINAILTQDPNKIKVYVGQKVYEIDINGIIHHILEDDIISYDGKNYSAGEFHEKYTNGIF